MGLGGYLLIWQKEYKRIEKGFYTDFGVGAPFLFYCQYNAEYNKH